MRFQVRQTGGPKVLNWTPIEVGEPGSGQVRLRQAAAGLHYIDVYHRTGYYSQPLPFFPGLEGAGTVEAIGTACALVMKQHAKIVDPVRLILEENIGPVFVDVAQRNGGYHGTLTVSGKIDAPTGAPAQADLAAVLSIESGEVSQSFFAGVGLPFCFAQLKSNEAVDRAAVDRAAWTATLSPSVVPQPLFLRRRATGRRQPLCSHARTRAGRRRGSRDGQRLCRPRRRHGIEA